MRRVRGRSANQGRLDFAQGLRSRTPEINAAILARIRMIPDPKVSEDVEYDLGLTSTVAAVLDYSFTCIQEGDGCPDRVPMEVLVQARRAARYGLSVDTLVLRYIAAHRLLGEFVMDEAEHSGVADDGSAMRSIRRTQEALLEQLTARAVAEFNEERERVARSTDHTRRQVVLRLLAGEQVDAATIGYQIAGAWHLGVVASGTMAERAMGRLGQELGCCVLVIHPLDGTTVWAWLGSRRRLGAEEIEHALSFCGPFDASVAIGDCRSDLRGWRLTHDEAQAAFPLAQRKPGRFTHCADVVLEAAVLQNSALTTSLLTRYLSPLDEMRMGGRVARETLSHYLACDNNASSAASSLGVSRHTIENRLRKIEETLGRALPNCLAELRVALSVESHQPH